MDVPLSNPVHLKPWLILPGVQIYAHRMTITLFAKPAFSIVSVSSSRVRLGNVVPIVYERAENPGREALMKPRMSPTVCVRFMRLTSLVPSASLICTLVVGNDWLTSNLVVIDPTLESSNVELLEDGKEPGSVLETEDELIALGTGLPSLCPAPEKGTLRFGGG